MSNETRSDPTDSVCRNCGQPPGPHFCGHCGQEVEERRGPLLAMAREFFADWFSLDGRLVRTTAALVRPGRLTRRYLDGKRAPYLRPMRLYLILSLLLFSSVLSLNTPDADKVDIYIAGEWVNQPDDLEAAEEARKKGRPRFSLLEPDTWLADYIRSRPDNPLDRMQSLPPQEILDIVFAGLRRALPFTLVIFLPFLALALKILYWRTGTFYVDHLIFAAHFQSALFLALTVVWLITRLLSTPLILNFLAYALASLVMIMVCLPLTLRRVYRQPWWLSGIKTIVLIFAYTRLLGVVMGVTVLWVIWRL